MQHPPKGLSRWAALVLTCLWLSSCSYEPPSTPTKPGKLSQALGRSSDEPDRATPRPTTSPELPKPADHYAFVFNTASTTVLARYRDDFLSVEFFWQAGFGVGSLSEPYLYVFLYDLDGSIFLYDAHREERIKLVDGIEVGGFAFSPSLDQDDELWFLGTSDPKLAALGIGFAYVKSPLPVEPEDSPSPSASPSPSPSPREKFHWPKDSPWTGVAAAVAPLNAFAVRHGGITSLRIASKGEFAVFSTADGGIYLYSRFDRKVLNLLPDQFLDEPMFADAPRVDPFYNRLVAWQNLRTNAVYLLDLWTGTIDTVPNLNLFTRGLREPGPKFMDAFQLVATYQVSPDSDISRLLVYNVLTQSIFPLLTPDPFPVPFPHR